MEQPILTEAEKSGGIEANEGKRRGSLTRRLGIIAFKGGLAVSSGLMSGNLLATVWSTEVPFGPGTAQATLSFDGQTTLDGGVSAARKELPEQFGVGPLKLGATLRLNEIPTLPDEQDDGNELFGSQDERRAQEYAELYRSVDNDAEDIARKLSEHVLMLSGLSAVVIAGSYTAIGSKNRRLILQQTKEKPLAPLIAVGALLYAAGQLPSAPVRDWQAVSTEYDGTALEGLEISGAPAQEIINRYGERILRYIRETDEFYEEALQNSERALNLRLLLGQRVKDNDSKVIIFFTDNHCNMGMPKIIANTGRLAAADYAFDPGDSSFTGSKYETRCVKAETQAFNNADIPLVWVGGNHDSADIGNAFERRGALVLDGSVEELASGLFVVGDADPRSSQFMQGIQSRGNKTIASLADDVAEIACDPEATPVVLIHDAKAAKRAIEEDCADLALVGHTHNKKIEEVVRTDGTSGFIITGGSSGGAKENQLTYGPLSAPAEFMLVAIKDGALVSRQEFALGTDGTLDIGPIIDQD